jgi:hypothetical protein
MRFRKFEKKAIIIAAYIPLISCISCHSKQLTYRDAFLQYSEIAKSLDRNEAIDSDREMALESFLSKSPDVEFLHSQLREYSRKERQEAATAILMKILPPQEMTDILLSVFHKSGAEFASSILNRISELDSKASFRLTCNIVKEDDRQPLVLFAIRSSSGYDKESKQVIAAILEKRIRREGSNGTHASSTDLLRDAGVRSGLLKTKH